MDNPCNSPDRNTVEEPSESNNLLKTIYVPKNLSILGTLLPKSNYLNENQVQKQNEKQEYSLLCLPPIINDDPRDNHNYQDQDYQDNQSMDQQSVISKRPQNGDKLRRGKSKGHHNPTDDTNSYSRQQKSNAPTPASLPGLKLQSKQHIRSAQQLAHLPPSSSQQSNYQSVKQSANGISNKSRKPPSVPQKEVVIENKKHHIVEATNQSQQQSSNGNACKLIMPSTTRNLSRSRVHQYDDFEDSSEINHNIKQLVKLSDIPFYNQHYQNTTSSKDNIQIRMPPSSSNQNRHPSIIVPKDKSKVMVDLSANFMLESDSENSNTINSLKCNPFKEHDSDYQQHQHESGYYDNHKRLPLLYKKKNHQLQSLNTSTAATEHVNTSQTRNTSKQSRQPIIDMLAEQ